MCIRHIPQAKTARALAQVEQLSDFSGWCPLVRVGCPVYVSISRTVISRRRQHECGKTHFDASHVYAMNRSRLEKVGRRNDLMNDKRFRREFQETQNELRLQSVAFVEIDNPLELYLFEPFAALSYGTSEWNTFRTH